MKWLKDMLLMTVWLAASWPCMHAVAADGHTHADACGIELCASTAHACHCHSCEEEPCPGKTVEIVKQRTVADHHLFRPARAALIVMTQPSAPCSSLPADRSGSLVRLQTVRLLI